MRQSYEEIEVPVGCVFVRGDEVVATGYNQTNVSRNGTRHAELVAMDKLLSAPGAPPVSILSECELFVTCEPCIMCAGILRQMRIKKVGETRWAQHVSFSEGVVFLWSRGEIASSRPCACLVQSATCPFPLCRHRCTLVAVTIGLGAVALFCRCIMTAITSLNVSRVCWQPKPSICFVYECVIFPPCMVRVDYLCLCTVTKKHVVVCCIHQEFYERGNMLVPLSKRHRSGRSQPDAGAPAPVSTSTNTSTSACSVAVSSVPPP